MALLKELVLKLEMFIQLIMEDLSVETLKFNVGLINSLATYCRVNKFGYVKGPQKVVNGKVTEIKYLSAIEEEKYTIAQANSALNKDGSFVKLVACRKNLNFELSTKDNIDYIDVSLNN